MTRTDFEKHSGISPITIGHYSSMMNSYLNPTIIEERKMNVAQMDVFSRLLMDRVIWLGVPIDDDVANIVQAQLLFLQSIDDKADISLYINTPGGIVSSGLGIYDTMNLITNDVSTICTGMAASMGSILLSSGTKGKRCILPHGKVMIHQPLGGVSGQASDILIEAKEIDKTRTELSNILAENTGHSLKKILKDAEQVTGWKTGKQSLKTKNRKLEQSHPQTNKNGGINIAKNR